MYIYVLSVGTPKLSTSHTQNIYIPKRRRAVLGLVFRDFMIKFSFKCFELEPTLDTKKTLSSSIRRVAIIFKELGHIALPPYREPGVTQSSPSTENRCWLSHLPLPSPLSTTQRPLHQSGIGGRAPKDEDQDATSPIVVTSFRT